MLFKTDFTVRFAHVDAAGIVYYPRYLELVNEAIERWFEEALGLPYREMCLVRRQGAPTRKITVEFLKSSALGDKLTLAIQVVKLGRSSFNLRITCTSGVETRFMCEVTMVYASLDPLTSIPIPDELRAKMLSFAGN